VLKMKSLKTFAKSCTQKLVQQKQGRIPLYSVGFEKKFYDHSFINNNNYNNKNWIDIFCS
jgi:hypothetical protein